MPPARCQTSQPAASPSGSLRPAPGDGRRRRRALGHAAASRLPPPVIAIPERLLVDRRRVLADDLAFVHDEDPVRERQDLVQLERDEQHGAPLVALLDEPPVDELDRADVEAARRLRGEQHARVAADLAREHDLLLVAARQRRSARLRAAAADVELVEQLRGAPRRSAPGTASRASRSAPLVVVEDEVLRQREVEDEAAPLAVLGDVAHARVEGLARRRVSRASLAGDRDRCRSPGAAGR